MQTNSADSYRLQLKPANLPPSREDVGEIEAHETEGGSVDLFTRGISGASADGRFLDRRTKNKLAIKTVSESAAASRLVFIGSGSLPIEVRKTAANQGFKPGDLKAAHWNDKSYFESKANCDEAEGRVDVVYY